MATKRSEVKMVKLGNNFVKPDSPVYIIAEAGVNHNGDVSQAVELIKAAAKAGADAVKFQTFKTEQVTTKQSPTAAYQKKNVGEESQWKLLRPLEIQEKDYPKLIRECKKAKIEFMSTPHGHIDSVKLLNPMVRIWKVGSGDLTNLPFLEFLGKTNKPIILSTGMATKPEIKEAVDTIIATGNDQIVILQCTTNYPCPDEDANVAMMFDIQKHNPDYLVGYSDHTVGIEASILAANLGATIIEKHFTLDRNLPGPDQKNSLEPKKLKEMIEKIQKKEQLDPAQAKIYLGSKLKKPLKSELIIAEMARKSVIAQKNIKKGQVFNEEMLTIKRPAKGGLHPREYWNIIGRKATRDIVADTQLKKYDY